VFRALRVRRAEFLKLARFYGVREARELQPVGAMVDSVVESWHRHGLVWWLSAFLVAAVVLRLLDV
jgi:hypothetical protein